jgi:hypothetical protein
MRIPKIPRYLNTVMAFLLYILGIYHYTQPNAAWRSGTIETITATFLLIAAYLLTSTGYIVTNVVFALIIAALGIRHVSFGGGWFSGITELIFAILLVIGALITKKKKTRS